MTYEIVIRNQTKSTKKSPIAGGSTEASDTTSGGSGGADGDMSLKKGAVKGLATVNRYIKPFVDQMASQYITTVSLRTGAQELEERMSFKMQVAQKSYSFLTSVITGALIGNLPGAIAGGIMSLTTMAIDYANKQERLDLQRGVENVGLRYINSRAGGSVESFSGSRMKKQ